ncbi:hypothetical protein Saso_77120 [Streptomyces asoensis]|uniref:Uncharacterized protein n=1 Tax=Streptomyces asoensis TaxID=249586 RepID=A0ABQ3SDP4_9ACTN|nr:hypothetical protein GCM10010496_76140 [Streptomyces asoensis]GHI66062.1 hypothetical protein Saso_77120 [Streptomyces asoensis]
MNVELVLADPLLLKVRRGTDKELPEPLDGYEWDGLRQLDHQHRTTHDESLASLGSHPQPVTQHALTTQAESDVIFPEGGT